MASSSVNVGGEICPTGQAKSIEQYGITWYFDRCIEYGQFINGDYWVKGPATIQTITPVPINGQNGFDVNPRPYSYYGYKYTSNLDWIGNDASGAPQTLPRTLSA